MGETAAEVRRQICDEIESDPLKMTILLNDPANRPKYQNHLAVMRADGEWGGDPELAAAKLVYPRGFVIYQDQQPQDHLNQAGVDTIYLHRVNGTHWEQMTRVAG